jgi:hypothetical protein
MLSQPQQPQQQPNDIIVSINREGQIVGVNVVDEEGAVVSLEPCQCALHRSIIPYETPLTKLRKSFCTVFTMIAILGIYYFATHPADVHNEWPIFNVFIISLLILGGSYLCTCCCSCQSYEQEELCALEQEMEFGMKWGARAVYVGMGIGGAILIAFGSISEGALQGFLLSVGITFVSTFIFITSYNWRHNRTLPF